MNLLSGPKKENISNGEWEGKERPAELAFYDKDPGVDSAQTTPWFAPGQMILYRVESDAPASL